MEIKEWFKHSYIASSTGKLANLLFSGAEAIGLYWIIVEELYQRKGKPIDREVLERRAKALRCDQGTLQALIDEDALQIDSNGYIYCARVQEELSDRIRSAEDISRARSEAGLKGARSRWGNKENEPLKDDSKDIAKDGICHDLSIAKWQTMANDGEKENKNNISNKSKSIGFPSNNVVKGGILKGGPVTDGRNSNGIAKDGICHDLPFNENSESFSIPYSNIQQHWNETAGKAGLPKCTVMSDKRRKAVKACFTAPGLGLELIYKACDLVAESDFLTGRNSGWGGCSFDWLFITNNMIKVLEGNYSNGRGSGSSRRNVPTDLNGQYQNDEGTEVTEL